MNDRLIKLKKALMWESGDSLRLLQNIENNPICSISVNISIPCIAVEWRQYATTTQLRFVLETLIVLIKQHGIGSILANDSALPLISAEDQTWISDDWFPRAVDAGWRVSANKLPDSYFGRLTTTQVQSIAPALVTIKNFSDMIKARQWLESFVAL